MSLPRIMLRSFRAALLNASVAVFALASVAPAATLFREVSTENLDIEFPLPASSRYFAVDLEEARNTLSAAPKENLTSRTAGLTVALPLPDNRSEEFTVWEIGLMHPDLAAKFPEIKTYAGRGIDNPYATVRITVTPAGFHGMILSDSPTVFIDPVRRGDSVNHATHYKSTAAQIAAGGEALVCDFETDPVMEAEISRLVAERRNRVERSVTGQELRTYRTCVAATGEYTGFHGGTVAAGQAAIVVSMNRVSGIYEKDVSVRFELIANNDLVVYTNSGTDPYTNGNGVTMLSQNQTNLNSVIGSGNYDVGHVFSTGGGGVASLGVICGSSKARGVTGRNAPIGDAFDVDFVAHEMGHQFGGNHTFNGNAGSCSGNRTASTAYEPGSGVTIMGYAGICGAQNIKTNSIETFHGVSYDQIAAFTQSGLGDNCPVTTATGNLPPVATAGNTGLTIPIDTPFILFGSVVEPDGDSWTASWEQFDLGPAGDPSAPVGDAPIFRSYLPKLENERRMFPRKGDVRNNVTTYGELLPSYSRTVTLRMTVRDGLGGIGFDTTALAVDGGSGPFLVTSTDTAPWDAGQTKTITWDVAGTDVSPVNTSHVNITLSLDDGLNYTEVLLANTPNDGSADIVVPALATTQARVQVEAVGNVFFDMNDTAFEITVTNTGVEQLASEAPAALKVQPNPFAGRAMVSFATERREHVSVSVYDAAGRQVTTLTDGVRNPGAHTVSWNGRDASGSRVAAGVYFVRMNAEGRRETARVVHLK